MNGSWRNSPITGISCRRRDGQGQPDAGRAADCDAGERALVAHLNMTSAENARRSTGRVSKQWLVHAGAAASAAARRSRAGTDGPDGLHVSQGRARSQAAHPGSGRGAATLRSKLKRDSETLNQGKNPTPG